MWHNPIIKTQPNPYHGYRYPAEIINHTVWLYHRFTMSFRDIEDLLAERCIVVTSTDKSTPVNSQKCRSYHRNAFEDSLS